MLIFFSILPIKVLLDNTFLSLNTKRICTERTYGFDHVALLSVRISLNISYLVVIKPMADVFDLQGHGNINGVCYR